MPVDLSVYRGLFVKSGIELVREYGVALNTLLQSPHKEPELVITLRRLTHSLKGQCLAMNYKTMGRMWYRMEKIFAHLMDNIDALDEHILKRLPQADHLEQHLQNIESEQTDKVVNEIIEELDAINDELGIVISKI